jgi:CheY-like chemotaxis protein
MAHIIVIEDNVENARLVAKLLNKSEHTVSLHATGEEGLTDSLAANPDLILIDMGLPDIDGQTVIALLRQQPHLQHIPLIAFTAWPEDTAYTMSKAYGCDGVILKPVNTRTFVSQIESFLKSSSGIQIPASSEG